MVGLLAPRPTPIRRTRPLYLYPPEAGCLPILVASYDTHGLRWDYSYSLVTTRGPLLPSSVLFFPDTPQLCFLGLKEIQMYCGLNIVSYDGCSRTGSEILIRCAFKSRSNSEKRFTIHFKISSNVLPQNLRITIHKIIILPLLPLGMKLSDS
jgi:hypothetical protein